MNFIYAKGLLRCGFAFADKIWYRISYFGLILKKYVTQYKQKFNRNPKLYLALVFSFALPPLHKIRHGRYLSYPMAYPGEQELSFPLFKF